MYEYERVISAILGDKIGDVTAAEVEKEMRSIRKNGLDGLNIHTFRKECEQALTRLVVMKGMEDDG